MLEELQNVLRAKGIPFHAEGNHIRCFPHVVNVAVQTGLAQLTDVDKTIYVDDSMNPEYQSALSNDVVAAARRLVSACRASGQRREDYLSTIREGNSTHAFGESIELPELELLRDVDTRWSSIFLMVDRVLTKTLNIFEAIARFLNDPKHDDLRCHALDQKQMQVLDEIRQFLQLPHVVQELLSAEMTPTLSQALPAYEKLLRGLKGMLAPGKLGKLAHGISASIDKLQEYLLRARPTRMYSLAMSTSDISCTTHSNVLILILTSVLNPTIKFQFLLDNWGATHVLDAEQWLRDAV
ncbi:hypothetical protein B0H21DRAFT_698741 [Amylocystis lapponica]|nr:hypothetical protein B0H21DRAFT_698741 [Amylocystis lapponica]